MKTASVIILFILYLMILFAGLDSMQPHCSDARGYLETFTSSLGIMFFIMLTYLLGFATGKDD